MATVPELYPFGYLGEIGGKAEALLPFTPPAHFGSGVSCHQFLPGYKHITVLLPEVGSVTSLR